jgi:hypothetical protein
MKLLGYRLGPGNDYLKVAPLGRIVQADRVLKK